MRESLQLQPEEQFLLLAADIDPDAAVYARMDALIPTIRNWETFATMAVGRCAAPLLTAKLGRLEQVGLIPEKVLRDLRQASLRTLSRNMLLTEYFRQVNKAFGAAGIPLIALKGAMLSEWLYGDINLRQFSDLDLLVPVEKGLESLDILQSMGFKPIDLRMSDFIKENNGIVHYPPMIKNGVSVEIHIRLHSQAEHYQVDLPGIWKRAIPLKLHGVDALGLCPEDLLLHLCFHLDKHFRSGEFQFTSLYDLVNMLNHKSGSIDWEVFEQSVLKANAVTETFKYLLLVQKYANANLPAPFSERYGNRLKSKDERLFLGMLRGKGVKLYTTSVLRVLENMNSLSKGFRYLFEIFFPSVDFMMKRYKLKHKSQLLLYYPIRQWSGVKTLWLTIKRLFS
jgi:hypothetical protein